MPSSAVTVQVSLYPRVIARSQLAPIISDAGETTASIATTGNFSLTCVSHEYATFSIALVTSADSTKKSNCENRRAQLRLKCVTTQCDGVYPVSYSVSTNDDTQTTWSLLSVQIGRRPTTPARQLDCRRAAAFARTSRVVNQRTRRARPLLSDAPYDHGGLPDSQHAAVFIDARRRCLSWRVHQNTREPAPPRGVRATQRHRFRGTRRQRISARK